MTAQRPSTESKQARRVPRPALSVGQQAELRCRNFVFLLVPGFSLITLAGSMEPLRALNRLAGFQAYDWTLASLEGEPVPTSSGIRLPARSLKDALADADYVIACAGFLREADEKRYVGAIRQAASRGIAIGSLSTGTRLLARAGVLSGYRCTTHWENLQAFREAFPELDCTNKLYVIDRDRLTCSGGTATLDMMLHLITEHHGVELGQAVANQFLHERIRSGSDDQPTDMQQSFSNMPETVRRAIRIMRNNIEEPVSLSFISLSIGIGDRQLERLFMRHAGTTPIRYYMRLRIERARELLIYTGRRIADIAEACGFSTTAHFAASYRRVFGTSPSDMRAEKDHLRMAGTVMRPH
jgi:AraC family transcriptional regulator, glycine betaine-responsive activator